jgi:hypothetical protein
MGDTVAEDIASRISGFFDETIITHLEFYRIWLPFDQISESKVCPRYVQVLSANSLSATYLGIDDLFCVAKDKIGSEPKTLWSKKEWGQQWRSGGAFSCQYLVPAILEVTQ